MKQHYVPEAYLQGFSGKNGELFFLDVDGLRKNFNVRVSRGNKSGICYHPDFYSIEDAQPDSAFPLLGLHKNFVESDILGTAETVYIERRDRLIERKNLTFDDILFMADWIIQMKLRNPFWRKHVLEANKDEWLQTSIKKITEKIHKDERWQHIPPAIRQLKINEELAKNIGDKAWAANIQKYGLIQRTDPKSGLNFNARVTIVNSVWAILEVPDTSEEEFITSDNPGFAIDTAGGLYNNKFVDDFAYMFPLTNRHCLQITSYSVRKLNYDPEKFILEKHRVPEWFIKNTNKLNCKFANAKIIGKRAKELEDLKPIIKQNLESQAVVV